LKEKQPITNMFKVNCCSCEIETVWSLLLNGQEAKLRCRLLNVIVVMGPTSALGRASSSGHDHHEMDRLLVV
jgi:hypothetical protein